MRTWAAVLAVSVVNLLLKAGGPVALGGRPLPRAARRVIGLVAPALLAALIVVELAGPEWESLDAPQLLGVAVAGVACLLRAPMLVAVLAGAVAAALVRLL